MTDIITAIILGVLTMLLFVALTSRVECKASREVTLKRVSAFTISCEAHHWISE